MNDYRSLLEDAADMIFCLDRQGNMVYCNSALEKQMGLLPGAAESQPLSSLLAPRDKNKLALSLKECSREKRPVTVQAEFKVRGSGGACFEICLSPLREKNRDGTILGIARNITERHREEVRRCNADKLTSFSEMVAIIVHQIRNPLGAISNCIGFLNEILELEDKQRELMRIVTDETRRLTKMMNEFSELTRLRKSNQVQTSLAVVLEEALELLKGDDRYKENISITSHFPPALPHVALDSSQVRLALWHILANAAEALPRGGEITIRGEKYLLGQERGVRINIRDNGSGIKKDKLPRVCEPFFSAKAGRNGLGLAVVHQVMSHHQGHVSVESEENKGTEVTLFFPFPVNDESGS